MTHADIDPRVAALTAALAAMHARALDSERRCDALRREIALAAADGTAIVEAAQDEIARLTAALDGCRNSLSAAAQNVADRDECERLRAEFDAASDAAIESLNARADEIDALRAERDAARRIADEALDLVSAALEHILGDRHAADLSAACSALHERLDALEETP